MSGARPYLLALWLCLWAQFATAHETWIAPDVYRAPAGASILIDIRNGQNFSGASLPWLDWWIDRFVAVEGAVERPLSGRLGDIPATRITPIAEGLMVIGLQSTLDRHPWSDWEAFKEFVASKRLLAVVDEHESRGWPRAGFFEVYRRCLKALIGVGNATGNDRALGFELEFVALTNPYSARSAGVMEVLLLENGDPLPNAPVTIFASHSTGTVVETSVLTDEHGIVRFSTEAATRYLLDAVTMRVAPAEAAASWYSLWAGMTFEAPLETQGRSH